MTGIISKVVKCIVHSTTITFTDHYQTVTTEVQSTAEQSTDEHLAEEQKLKDAFDEIADVNGYITKSELEVYFQKNNKNPKERDIDSLVGADMDGDGKISKDEFLRIHQKASTMDFYSSDIKGELVDALLVFDENNDGTINKDELKKILVDYDDKALEEIIGYVDTNQDGKISIEELAEFLTKL